MLRSSLATLALTVALGGALSACASDEPEPDAPATPSTPSASETPAEPTEVSFGDAESVTWEPTNNLLTELSIEVERVREGRFADFKDLVASGITEANQPYYVDVVITNEGDAEIGGLDVPLYLVDSTQILSPPSKFATPFEPCPSGPLPASFGAGERAEMCLVFFSSPSADFQSITFQPALEAAAVSWTGEVEAPTVKQKSGQDRKRKRR